MYTLLHAKSVLAIGAPKSGHENVNSSSLPSHDPGRDTPRPAEHQDSNAKADGQNVPAPEAEACTGELGAAPWKEEVELSLH